MSARVPSSAYDPAIHHRRSIRLRGHDYASGGVYFVTICTANNRPLFGTVVNGRMALNDAGRIAARCWHEIPSHFPHATLDEWIIMPDHVHGIVVLRGDGGTACRAPTFGHPIAGCLGTIMGAFKSATTRHMGLACQAPPNAPACQAPAWQRNYYDIIVRDERALNNIRTYICNNPANWDVHRYGEPRFFAGNRALLDLPMTAFLASRGGSDAARTGLACHAPPEGLACHAPPEGLACHAPSQWPMPPECVVSGSLSPMERAVFDACIADEIPTVHIMARGLPATFPALLQRAIDAGRLLVMTPFDSLVDRFSARRAAWCNQYALHLAKNVIIGHMTSGGMLACLLADVPRDKPVFHLSKHEDATPTTEDHPWRIGVRVPGKGQR